jgi:hypothetical protein
LSNISSNIGSIDIAINNISTNSLSEVISYIYLSLYSYLPPDQFIISSINFKLIF